MRIAVVVRSLKIGGMERVAISLTKAFQDEGHDTHLIYFKKKKDHYSTEGIHNLHFWNFDTFLAKSVIGIFYEIFIRLLNIPFRRSYAITKGFITSFIFKYKLKKLEKNANPFDLIIIRGQGTFELLWYKQDKRYIQVCESLFYNDKKMNFFNKLYTKALYDKKQLACVSNGIVESFKTLEENSNIKAGKVIKITNSVDIDNIEESSQSYKPYVEEPYIVSIGRITPIKRLPLLIDAYYYMKEKYNLPHKLVIVGQGSDEKNIKNKINSLNMQESIILTGVQTNPYPWMGNADLFVLSSMNEGLGMVLLEALACKTPLIATKSDGGVIDIMKNELAQYLCDPTAEALGEKIANVLTNPKEIDFNKHLEEFSPSTIAKKYIEEFHTEK